MAVSGRTTRVATGDRAPAPVRRPAVTGVAGLLRRPASRWARAALVAVNLAAVAAFLLSYSRHAVGFGPYRIDLGVYRFGGRTWLRGGDLYRQVLVSQGLRLPFTYPPIAAVVLAPLALLPMAAAGTVLTVASVALAAVVLGLFLRRLAGPAAWSPWAVGWLLPAALLLEPVRSTLAYGQINIVLMALVTLDGLTAEPRWPRGALTGLAAAVKLTPAAFVLFFLLRRDYRAAATAAGSFAAATAAGFALAGPDSVRYWTSIVFQTGRIGVPAMSANQCIQAVLARAGLGPHTVPGVAGWLMLSAAVLLAAYRGMRHALAAGQDCLALSLNAFAALLISPVSWSHHWVWCAPALLTVADLGRRHRRRLAGAAAAGGLVLFTVAPQWWLGKFAGPELSWAPWQQLIGSSYVWFAVLVLFLAACGQLTPPATTVRTVMTVDSVFMATDAELAFADQAGRFYTREYGFPPVTGRLLGYLTVCDPPQQTINELAETLLASRSAITGAVRQLEGFHAVRRTRAAGDRLDRVSLDPAAGLQPKGFSPAPYLEQAALAREALDLLPSAPTERRAVLADAAEFYDFLAQRLPEVLEEWRGQHQPSKT